MKKNITFILIFSIGFLFSQDISVEKKNFHLLSITHKIDELLHFNVSNLKDNKTILNLKEKLDSELSTVASCVLHYKYSDALNLSEDDQLELLERMRLIANGFLKDDKYILFESSGGIAPVIGIREESISNKKVLTVLLGGDCSITKVDIKEEEIYTIFNNTIKEALEK